MKKIKDVQRTENGFTYTLKRAYRAVYGFGEKFDNVNQKGKYVRACVREKCFYQGEYAYLSMPFFVTVDGFGLYVDTYLETDFDLRTEGEITVSFPVGSRGEQADVYLLEGTPKEIVSEFRKIVGMPRLFPKWTLGAWMSGNRWDSQEEVEKQVQLAKEYQFPHNVIVIEPWSDLTTHCLWNDSVIPEKAGNETVSYAEMQFGGRWNDPKGMIDRLHTDGLRLLLWIVPIYAQREDMQTKCHVDYCLRENEAVIAGGECVLNADGTPYEIPHTWCIGSMVPDFTNAEAKKHWLKRFEYLKEMGVDGFKTDGGEFIHEKTVRFADGTTGAEGQNAYCEQYTRAFAELMGEEGIVFSRAGGQRSPMFSVIWAGDQESTWSEFSSVLKAGLSAAFCGVNSWGFDIAGFSGYLPTKELYLRAVQTAAFLPVMQWHSDPLSNGRCDFSGAWKINDRSPWNIAAFYKDESILANCCKQFYLHYNLMPYQYMLLMQSAETGIAPLRHLAMEFPEDENTFNIENEFMLGSALLVAPVLEDYISSMEIYLPEGEWLDLYTGELFCGGKHTVALQEDRLPVYVRRNACVPLNLAGGKLCSDVGNRLDCYTELTFLINGSGEYRFTDDMGNQIELQWDENTWTERENVRKIAFHVIRMGNAKLF